MIYILLSIIITSNISCSSLALDIALNNFKNRLNTLTTTLTGPKATTPSLSDLPFAPGVTWNPLTVDQVRTTWGLHTGGIKSCPNAENLLYIAMYGETNAEIVRIVRQGGGDDEQKAQYPTILNSANDVFDIALNLYKKYPDCMFGTPSWQNIGGARTALQDILALANAFDMQKNKLIDQDLLAHIINAYEMARGFERAKVPGGIIIWMQAEKKYDKLFGPDAYKKAKTKLNLPSDRP